MIDVQPISITAPHWSSIISFAKKYLLNNPVAALDQAGISMKDIASFSAIADFSPSPLATLQNPYSFAHHHTSMGFLIIAPERDINDLRFLVEGFHITKTNQVTESGHLVIIMTGTVKQWYNLIMNQLRSKVNRPPGICQILSKCLESIAQTTFLKLFQNYQRIKQADGTILLERVINV